MSVGNFFFIFLILCSSISCTEAIAKKKVKLQSQPKSSIVLDFSHKQKVLFSEQPDATRHPASLTKMMTIYLLLESLKSKRISLDTKFKVSKLASDQAPSKLGLKVGEKIKVTDVIKALLVKSANDVAVVAAEGLCGNIKKFAAVMNKKAKQLGMNHTHFENPSGLPNKLQVTTARDIVILGVALFKHFPQYWHYFKLKSFQYGQTTHQTHCKILKWYKGADGAKTGYICASGFNLFVTAQKYNKQGNSKRLFIVVMGGSSSKARDIYAAHLMDRFFENYQISVQNNVDSNLTTKIVKNTNKALSNQIDKAEPKDLEKVLDEDEEININKILDYSSDETMNINELYVYDEEFLDGSVEVLDEEVIKHAKKTTKKRLKTRKKRKKLMS